MTAFRPDIEGLRAVSILMVLAYHFAGAWLPGGFVGVDVFLVISGYLITQSLLDQHAAGESLRSNLLRFWARRARRLLPNALLVLAAVSMAGAWGLDDPALSRLGSDVAWAAGYAINWLYVSRSVDYLRWGESDGSVLLNYWSLAVEEQFYLVWPLLLLVLWRHAGSGKRALRVVVMLAMAAALLSLGYMLSLSRAGLTPAFFASPARAWELLLGAALVLQSRRSQGNPGNWGAVAGWVGLIGVLVGAGTMSPASHHPGWITLIPVLGTALLIGGLADQPAMPLARWLGSAPLRALGARSYSIYLWHWPVLTLGTHWWPQRSAAMLLLWLVLSLLLAEVAYRGIESPARWRWARAAPASRVLLLALAGSLILAAVGIGLRRTAEGSTRQAWLPMAPRGSVGLPPLQEVKGDLPDVYRDGCHLGVAPTLPAEPCRLGSADARTVLLFGDSHAAQWAPALQRAAVGRGLALISWTKSSCPSADVTVWNPAARGPYRECDAWREAVFARLATLRPALVVVSNLIDGETDIVSRADGRLLQGDDAAAAFDAGLTSTLRRLRAAGVPVVMLRDNPRPRRDVMNCLYASPDPGRCERLRVEALPSDARDLRAARAAGVPVWDLGSAICGPVSCPVLATVGEPPRAQVVYRDDNHLTASFAASLAPELERVWAADPPVDRER